jgi:enterochelin esterase-like enzyme
MKIFIAIISGILILGTIFSINNWDILFSNIQHAYYSLQMSKVTDSKSEIRTISLKSNELDGINKEAKVYLPEAYMKNGNQRFPVLYLLHGFPGTDNDWLINTNLQARLDDKINQHIIPPLIVVFPDAQGQIIRDSQYIDGTKVKQKMESYIIKELIPYIDTSLRTIPARGSRAIGGISSGAYGAMYLGLRHNNIFSIIISHSGYFINNESPMNNLIGKDNQIRNNYNPLSFISRMSLDPKSYIYFDIGKNDDSGFLATNLGFDKILNEKNVYHEFLITDGGHGWGVWTKNINSSLAFLGKHIVDK